MNKISAVYKITNTITGDFYIGSSKDVKRRLAVHKCQSTWKKYPNKQLYLDMEKYSLENFAFEILAEVEPDKLKESEQKFIETLNPTYNNRNANGLDIERYKETNRKANRKYQKTDKGKEANRKSSKKYYKTDKGKEANRKSSNKYNNQLCNYNGETLTLCALSTRFSRMGIEHPTLEAKKYLLEQSI